MIGKGLKKVLGEGGKMVVAKWQGKTIAESTKCVVIEGNQYFPPESVHKEYLQPNPTTSTCPWKGVASYYDVIVNGQVNDGAAWYYPNPKPAAAHIKDYVAFWKGIKVA